MKKVVFWVICLSIFLSLSALGAVNEEDVSVASFSYTNGEGEVLESLAAGETVKANAELVLLNDAEGLKLDTAILLYDCGKLVKGDYETVDFSESSEAAVELSVVIPDNITEPSLVTVFWDSFETMNPVASPAYFGSNDPELYDIKINGSSIGVEKNLYEYSKTLYVGEDDIPYVPLYIPRDLTSNIISNKIGNIINIGVNSFSGAVAEYNVGVDVAVPKITVARYGCRGAHARYDWDAKVDLTQDGAINKNIYYNPTTEVVQGSSRRVGMDFYVPEIPEGYKVKAAKLSFYASTTAEALNTRIYRTSDDWFDGTVSGNWPAIKNEISLEPVEVKNAEYDESGELIPSENGFYKYTFAINPEEIAGETFLPVTLKYDWIGKAYRLNIMCTDTNKLPCLEIELEEV